jgi:predicted transcriptional regulator
MKAFTLRLQDEVNEELEYLTNILMQTKTAVLEGLIRQEYHKYQADPKIQKAMKQLREVKDFIEKMNQNS